MYNKKIFLKCFKKILFALFIFIFSCFVNDLLVNAAENDDYLAIEKIYADVDINDDFDETSVIVILDSTVSEINKDHSSTIFKDINYLEIIDLTFVNDVTTIRDIENFEQILKIKLSNPGKENVINMINDLSLIKGIKYAGPNRYLKVEQQPNDPLYSSSISALNGQWAHDNIDSESAWDFSTGNSEVRIGVIDSGVASHEDLNANVVDGYDFTNMVDDETPGSLRDDISGHGTHIAGIIGAVGNQTSPLGIVGVNWDITIVPMQVGLPNGSIDSTACVSAINFARELWNTKERISILSMSISAYSEWPEIESAIRRYKGLFVCSTGNKDQDNDNPKLHNFPSYYGSSLYSDPLPNLISVGRIDINNERPMNDDANWGQRTISIYAPGQYVLSTYPELICQNHDDVFYDGTRMCEFSIGNRTILYSYIDSGQYTLNQILNNFNLIFGNTPSFYAASDHHSNGYHYMTGSSMSTPYVAGVAALLLSLNKELTAVQLKQAILNSADQITITIPNGTTQNVKKLNAYNAVKYVLENYMNSTTYTLSNNSSAVNTNKVITSDATYFDELNGFYKLNVTYAKRYEFISSSTSGIEVILYDEDFNEIPYNDLYSTSNKVRFIENLSTGTYYLRTKYANKESTGTISTTIRNICQGCNSLYRERVALNCQTEPFEDSLYLQQNQPIIYELDLECNTRYEFEVESPKLLSVGLYDENMTLLADFLYYKKTNHNYYYFNIQDLEEGRYHIKIELDSESLDCDIQVTLGHRPTTPEEILVNQPVDVLEHLHYNQNSYYFMRNRPGIYEVVLTGTSSSGTLVYPEGTITIVRGDNVVQKYVFTKGDYDNPATSLYGSNTMTWLVDDYASYYINIDIHSTGLTSLQLEVRELETFSLSASDEYSKSSPLISGDKFEILNVERAGEYKVKATYTGNQVEDMLFVILRKNSEGLFEEIDGGLVNNTLHFETNVILNTYEQIYIGYFNGKGSGTFSLNIDRNVSNTFSLITDPNSNVIVGSEVSLNNGVYGGTTLTQGYTRIVYLGIDAPYIESRTQYNWYTTDSSVAIVSSFGTVTATATWTGSQTYKTVTIRAVYKNDITVVGEIELTVYKDPNANSTTKKILQYYGMDVRGDGTTGTEVSQNGGSKIEIGYMPEVTITKGYTRYICLGTDSPSNIIQHFTWSVSRQTGETGNASVSQYGTITAISEGYITIKGVYKYNPQYEIYITIKVV